MVRRRLGVDSRDAQSGHLVKHWPKEARLAAQHGQDQAVQIALELVLVSQQSSQFVTGSAFLHLRVERVEATGQLHRSAVSSSVGVQGIQATPLVHQLVLLVSNFLVA